MMNLLGFIMSLVYMQAVPGRLSAYERLVNSQSFFSPYLTQEDLSRFGRDYITVGDYISRVFPFLGVRFISVNDGFDSSNPLDIDSLDTSFRTLIYDLYSCDLSRRVKSAKRPEPNAGRFSVPTRLTDMSKTRRTRIIFW